MSLKKLGFLVIKNTNEYDSFKRDYVTDIKKIRNFNSFEFIVCFARDIRESKENIFKIFTIAHELQHILQYVCFGGKDIQHSKIYWYYRVKKMDTNELPKEVDAIRKAKMVNCIMSNKKDVDDFIDKTIKISFNPQAKRYWEIVKGLDIKYRNSVVLETEILWETLETKIEDKGKELRLEKEITEDERNLLNLLEQ